jgi:hypothetical protein
LLAAADAFRFRWRSALRFARLPLGFLCFLHAACSFISCFIFSAARRYAIISFTPIFAAILISPADDTLFTIFAAIPPRLRRLFSLLSFRRFRHFC